MLKQGSADVFVDDHSEVVVEIPDPLLKLFRRFTLIDGLQEKAGSVYYTIIIRGFLKLQLELTIM